MDGQIKSDFWAYENNLDVLIQHIKEYNENAPCNCKPKEFLVCWKHTFERDLQILESSKTATSQQFYNDPNEMHQ